MKSKFIITVFIIFICNIINAQEITSYMLVTPEYKFQGNKIYIHDMENKGEKNSQDIAKKFSDKMHKILNKDRISNTDGIFNPWLMKFPFYLVDKESEADVIIKSDYSFFTNQDIKTEKIKERWLPNTKYRLFYFENVITNQVIFNVNYHIFNKKGEEIDAICKSDTITSNSLGKKPIRSIEELTERICRYYSVSQFKPYFKEVNYIFKKVKFKGDKNLKAELKTCNALIKASKIKEAGAIYKKVFEASGVKEAAFNTGMCYELVGNFEKALVYYAKAPDIFAKVRMREQMLTYNYLKSIGYDMPKVEF